MLVLKILEKIKEKRLKFSQGIVTWKNYQKARVKVTTTKLSKLKSAAKNNTETILRLNKKIFEDDELPHEWFLITRQTTKIRNVPLLTICQQIWNIEKLKYLK